MSVCGGRNMIDGRYSEKKNTDKKKHLNSFNGHQRSDITEVLLGHVVFSALKWQMFL
jgi:hypothetical protein